MTYNTHPEYQRLCEIEDIEARKSAIIEYQSRVGLVIGKFYPPHRGHHMVIDTASAECSGDHGKLLVAVIHSDAESIPVEDRIAWLRDRHPEPWINFFPVLDNTPVEYSERSYRSFLSALVPAIEHNCWHGRYSLSNNYDSFPNTLYSGEDYAPDLARRIIARAKEDPTRLFVPKEMKVRGFNRSNIPLSATKVREDPESHWDELAPATKAGLCKRVVVCGPESSGTTTLVKGIQKDYFDTAVVPEWGRAYEWALGPNHHWTDEDFYLIAREQKRSEDIYARHTKGGLLLCDTDEFATAMFQQMYLGYDEPDEKLMEMALASPADLYLLTSPNGVPATQDGQRNHLDERQQQMDWFIDNIPAELNVQIMHGPDYFRRESARVAIDWLLQEGWKFTDPIEYRDGYAEEFVWDEEIEGD